MQLWQHFEWSARARETSSNPNSATVPYVYQETFSLSGLDTSTVVITGEWSGDNYGYIVVNGTKVSIDGTGRMEYTNSPGESSFSAASSSTPPTLLSSRGRTPSNSTCSITRTVRPM